MKKFFLVFFLLAVALAVYPFLLPDEQPRKLTGLPWQIEVLPDGSSRVFGIHIGHSRLSDVLQQLGNDMQLAIVAASGENGSLEMYYGHYKAGLLSGKLVLQADADEAAIARWREHSPRSEYMATGRAKKYYIDESDRTEVLDAVVSGISFIPAVNLDEQVVLARFGKPSRQLTRNGVSHYLYPGKGLHVALSPQEKEVLQYVSPSRFEGLVAPLETDGQH